MRSWGGRDGGDGGGWHGGGCCLETIGTEGKEIIWEEGGKGEVGGLESRKGPQVCGLGDWLFPQAFVHCGDGEGGRTE
jgi:hypothetical protein